ncbi:Zinc finger CCCH-type [Penicillium longicatenatum]|uniref:Zinc finger CCCH-type n=1 Tax=Penicillium longicatenatum TaxID=1561947 RepID=UPI0025499381|nr:Zinc finger CCCH-type [Penicillium longicatenatum]KAJ5658199.1 Zinc finger CCCH-type [Penicillium longicatenatum]KAJ5663875.1 Zinc finger CCCH-type [Penicillium longicatenatum]
MLRESDIDSLNNHLASLSQENQRNHENLQGLLNQFRNLLDDYSSLKSDYEEVKEGREKYKRQARGQERNPFVLVLVDGDGYLFKEHFLKAGSEGGIKAARELSDSVRELMHSTMGMQADSCRIMVRVYANILGLSKVLARAGMVGHEARSLSPFTSSFTRAQDLFDFVDAAEKKEGSDFKIREMFRLFVDLNQCRHIYFAGCHDTGFTSLLTPYRGSDRITLIKAASFHREFEDLNLPIRELPSVFMSTPLAVTKPAAPVQTINTKITNTMTGTKPICKHFQKQGICKFGVGCNKQHVSPNQQLARSADSDSPSPKQLWSSPTVVGRSQEFLTATLPTQSLKSEEYIPINKDGDRLDTYCPHPSPEAFDEYHRRAKEHRVCNSYHLSGECGDMGCQYDHSDVSNTIIEVLRYILLQHPCSRAGACRSIKCYLGHICQKPNCKAVKSWQCRFNHRTHTLDLQVAQWVAPVEQAEADDDRDDRSTISGESFQSQSPSNMIYVM